MHQHSSITNEKDELPTQKHISLNFQLQLLHACGKFNVELSLSFSLSLVFPAPSRVMCFMKNIFPFHQFLMKTQAKPNNMENHHTTRGKMCLASALILP
jgi:hypothetical protein